METNQQFSLRWNNYVQHITCAFDNLRSDEDLVDVTLSCEGRKILAHKMLLSACSTYFKNVFKVSGRHCKHLQTFLLRKYLLFCLIFLTLFYE